MTTDDRREPTSPADLALTVQRRASDVATDAARRTSLLPDRLADTVDVEVGQTPAEVVYTENKLELLHYEPLTAHQSRVPILVVYALINRPYILDLQPDRSIVRRFLEAGHDVYLIDWHEPSPLDRRLGLADYVCRYIDNCVDVLRERSGRDAVNVLGYCMGGTLSVIYTALWPEKVNALGLLATGLCFEDTGGILEQWGDEDHFDPWALVDAYGNVPGEFLTVGFDVMDPVANNLTKYVGLADRLENEDFVRNFARMERWLSDSVDLAGTVYAEFVEEIYQRNRLCRNELTVDGRHVDVTAIDVPLLQIVGQRDHLVPPTASIPFNDVVGSDDVTTISYPSGHVGLAMSNRAHRDLWPEVAEWFLEQSDRPTLADVFGEGVEEALGVDVETDVTVGDVDEMAVGLGDDRGEIARAVVERDAAALKSFLEDALDVQIRLDSGPAGIAVAVETDDGVVTTTIGNVGEAIRTEVEESIARTDVAAAYDLEELEGIGNTYAGRLRDAGIESVAQLAVADPADVAAAAETGKQLARNWVERARTLVGDVEHGG
ncbi:class III poly(R)-hydroxyalkanoic acid synthase subunit PhaC [Haloarchaeobius baliensis]|uniref:class III poly(R)-hydroxyalkanoic acid synthase subunit PhaC n=1 Tax=Haloarchaeobius baliensis TaxID=1670458 RepID=UPI003F884C8C